jgi:two-component system, NarL family, nitrate/nitrite response regulator NarL
MPNMCEMTESLTYREKQIIGYLKQGKSNKEIATLLSTSYDTIRTTLTRLFEKTGCSNRTQLAIKALENNFFTSQRVA